jgi:hypothetical protein
MLGTRVAAAELRDQVESGLDEGCTVQVDFKGLLVSQSFMDEFLGVLITRHGPAVLDRVEFKNCHDEVKAAARFVTNMRSREYEEIRTSA